MVVLKDCCTSYGKCVQEIGDVALLNSEYSMRSWLHNSDWQNCGSPGAVRAMELNLECLESNRSLYNFTWKL